MPKDFQKPQPNKTERVLTELMMHQEMVGRDMWTISSNVIALGILLNVDPKKIAEHLVDDTKVKEYASKINEAIRELQEAKRAEMKDDEKGDKPEIVEETK